MPVYKVSGTISEDSRVLVINESNWTVESNTEESVGSYEVTTSGGYKTVLSRQSDGATLGFGSVTPIAIYTTNSGTPESTTGTDDGYIGNVGSMFFNNNQSTVVFGNISGAGGRAFFRFPNVTIPTDSTITLAKLHIKSDLSTERTGYCKVKIGFNDEDDATAPSDVATTQALSITTGVLWEPEDYTLNTWYESPNISSDLQEVIDRIGWSSGNAVMVLVDEDGSNAGIRRIVQSYEQGSPALPYLEIEWAE